LISIPHSFGNLHNLSLLNLTDNNLTQIPQSFGSLKNLKYVNLSDNQITFSNNNKRWNFHYLIEMNLSNNKLESFPLFVNPVLSKLDISGNFIKMVPGELFESSLTLLNLSSNKIKTIPKSFQNMISLERLDISFNELEEAPELGNLFMLTNLLLDCNNIKKIPENYKLLDNLEQLSLHNNPIEEIPNEVKNLPKLKYIDL